MSDPASYDITVEGGIPVVLPSGSEYSVLTEAEREYIEDKIQRYLSDNHFCLPAGELVTTTRGPVPVEEIVSGDEVLGYDGRRRLQWDRVKVRHVLAPQPIFRVRTGNRTLRCSPGHMVLVRHREKGSRWKPVEYRLEWKRADELKRGDVVVVQNGHPSVELSAHPEMSLDFLEFCGLFLGDGLTVAGRYVRICRAEDATYMDHYRAIIPTLFTKVDGSPVVLAERGYTEFGSREAVDLLESLTLCGGSRGKVVPHWVHELDRKQQLAFLRGYVDADGHVDKKGRIWFASPNRRLIEGFRHMCISVGVPVNNLNVTSNDFGPVYAFMCWDPVANAEIGTNDTRYSFEVEREVRNDGLYLDRHGRGDVAPECSRFSRVLEVTVEDSEPVFDLVVEGGHSFVASGVVTHNTNVVDLTDLDKLLVNELLIHRWGLWLATGRDYYGEDVPVKTIAELMNQYQTQCRGLKKALNLDKVSRDRAHGDDSIPAFWDDLKRRAQEFGVMRNAQFNQVLESFQRVKAMIQFHDNCLAGDTMVITSSGTKRIDELVGTAELLDGNGGWVNCQVEAMGIQPLYEIELQRNRTTKIVRATAEHRWFARKRTSDGATRELMTSELSPGDRMVTIVGRRRRQEPSPWGVAHGIVFGDGTREGVRGAGCKVRLCGEKDRQLLKWFPLSDTRTVEGDLVVTGLPYSWKDVPSWEMDSAYLFGWLAGYFAADGAMDQAGSAHLDSVKRSNVEFARDVCYRLGIPTLAVSSYTRNGFPTAVDDGPAEMWRLRFPVGAIEDEFFLIDEHRRRNRQRASRAVLPDWKVVSVRSVGTGEVYCPRVPTTHSFVLADNLLTGNCDEQERLEQHCTLDDVIEVIREEIEAFDAIDDEFRQTQQKLWIRRQ